MAVGLIVQDRSLSLLVWVGSILPEFYVFKAFQCFIKLAGGVLGYLKAGSRPSGSSLSTAFTRPLRSLPAEYAIGLLVL